MRSLIALSASVCVAAGVALAQDASKKHELIYRWDQLDGKAAVYDAEVVTTVTVDRKGLTQTTEADEGEDTGDTRLESTTTTKQRLTMTFKVGERGRGLVTVATERLQVAVEQKAMGKDQKIVYDSSKPPPEGVPEQLKATVASLLGKPYTLTVSRRGVVEKLEGRPAAELDAFKGTFLMLPDTPCAEGGSWTQVQRHPTAPLGDIVNTATYKLAKVTEKDERQIETSASTELDDKSSSLPTGTVARIENPTGTGHLTLDARGLKLEEETTQGYELVVKQIRPAMEQRNKLLSTFRWKLVEVKDAK